MSPRSADWRCDDGSGRLVDDVDAGTDADAQAALHLERDQCLAHGGPRDAELLGQLPLGGQPAADTVLAIVDELAQLIGDLAVQAAWFNDGQRQLPHSKRFPHSLFLAGLGGHLVRPFDNPAIVSS